MNAYTPVKARAERLVDLSARYSDASGHAARLRFLWKKHAWHLLVGGASALRKFAAAKSSASKKRPRIRNRTMRRPAFIMYDQTVFSKIHTLVPSGRGELEITDVNNMYIKEGTMTSALLEGWWTDAGMFDSLLRATNLVAESRIQNKVEVPAA
jgi:NDP-sugar pyrophosphorylase family protein